MRFVIVGFLIPLLFAEILSAVEFDPHSLKGERGTWFEKSDSFKNEKYFDYSYENHIVFRVLERRVPTMNALISEAKRVRGNLYLKNPNVIFFASQEEIENCFSIKNRSQMIISPTELILNKIPRPFGRHRYFAQLGLDTEAIKIRKGMYKELQITKISATAAKEKLQIDMEMLFEGRKGCVIRLDAEK